ncbi:MAG: DUF4293 family protein [Balneolaceae bacterium]|nr:MAG: DUF4293 family protein [Balneolaceae bacterium]
MIQRIQTIFLTLALLLNIAFFFTPLFERVLEDPSGWFRSAILTAVGLAAILTAASIFMYKNRIRQMRWVKNAMIFQILASGTGVGVFFTLGRIGAHLTGEAAGLAFLILAVLFQLLANASIKKDERLVKSIDRIR